MKTNEYGEALDRNGYAPSIWSDGRCVCCGRADGLQRHEVYHGSNRERSKNLGCWVTICCECHMGLHHRDAGVDKALKIQMQEKAMDHYGWSVEDFRQRFGRSWL